ncbi:urease accessory protein UreE [Rhodobaculum claviforme]|uniref:Urease accessory protein UreE n=1 Tax=Rhodobaculum claviforme TaxID=1549854 RepID=A0A934WIE8_9RHOB|nr:urease accessory protein UreE [Rhodobaculum claviforme]MBK5928140.1 urease accessory protein UreE [Rhodobaculum claviforme]
MSQSPVIAADVRRAGDWSGRPADQVTLDYEARFLRRKRLTADGGTVFVVDLPETVSLEDGDALVLAGGAMVEVKAAAEPLVAVTGPALTRLAWHIGNRHTPCEIAPDRLVIRHDHVLEEMLRGLGATLEAFDGPFRPEGGAYGHGRTMGHSHGHSHGHDEGDGKAQRAYLDASDLSGGDGGE